MNVLFGVNYIKYSKTYTIGRGSDGESRENYPICGIIQTRMEKQIIVYEPDEQTKMEVKTDGETVWLTQQQMADLFGVQKAAISKHIKNIYACGELLEPLTVSKMETVQAASTTSLNSLPRRRSRPGATRSDFTHDIWLSIKCTFSSP